MSTDSTSKVAVPTAQATQTKTSVAPTTQVQPKPVLAKPEQKYKSEDYDGAPIVKLALITADTMQYDARYKLKLDSTEPVEMPLTPFFAERLNRTVKLVL